MDHGAITAAPFSARSFGSSVVYRDCVRLDTE